MHLSERSLEIADLMTKRADNNLNYYLEGENNDRREIQANLYVLNQVVTSFKREKEEELAKKYEAIFSRQSASFSRRRLA